MEKFCAPIFVETAVEPQIPQMTALQPKLSSRCNTQISGFKLKELQHLTLFMQTFINE
jgi:hypothetical protein